MRIQQINSRIALKLCCIKLLVSSLLIVAEIVTCPAKQPHLMHIQHTM